MLAAPRGLSQLAASFVALRCQGIRRMPVSACVDNRVRAPVLKTGGPSGPALVAAFIWFVEKSLRLSKNKKGWNPSPLHWGAGGRDWSRTSDLVLIRDAL